MPAQELRCPIRWETADVRACLRQDDLCRFCIHSGNRVDQPLILVKRAEPLFNLRTQPLDALIQIIDMGASNSMMSNR